MPFSLKILVHEIKLVVSEVLLIEEPILSVTFANYPKIFIKGRSKLSSTSYEKVFSHGKSALLQVDQEKLEEILKEQPLELMLLNGTRILAGGRINLDQFIHTINLEFRFKRGNFHLLDHFGKPYALADISLSIHDINLEPPEVPTIKQLLSGQIEPPPDQIVYKKKNQKPPIGKRTEENPIANPINQEERNDKSPNQRTSQKLPSLIIIIDKEKLIESDVREISKLKSAAQLQEDSNKKLEEFTYLQQRIVEVFDQDDINEFYKTLELLESKVMIGLFKEPHVELAHFMKGVDYIFKNRDTQKREDLLSLLTIMQSIISELRIKILSEQVEQQIDVLDKQIFYAQSKHTHNIARDDLIELLRKLEMDYIPSWRSIEDHRESAGLLEAISFSSEKAEKIATKSINYHTSLRSTINSMIERFLKR